MAKKILYVRSGPYDLNVSSYNVQEFGLGEAFCKLGYDFDFVTFKKKKQKEWIFFEHNGCRARCMELPRRRICRWGINLSICKKEFLEQYDYVICSEYMQIMSYLLSRNAKRMFIYNGPYYNLFMFKFFSPIYDCIFTRVLKRNVIRIFTKSVLAERFLRSKSYERITTVGVGLDTRRFDSCDSIDESTKAIVEYMKLHKCILYVGAISERKNYKFMLNVYKKVLRQHPETKFVVIGKSVVGPFAKIVGKKDSDYELECVKHLDSNVKDGIYRVQSIDNSQLKYIYPLAKAFLLPSKQEIFGMVLLEAMYLGAPVVTSRNGGSTTLIEGKNSGQIVPFDEELWANAVDKYLRDEKYCKQVSQNARDVVVNEYNWNNIAKSMANFFVDDIDA